MGIIIFNGISSQKYGIQVEHPPGYSTPERDYEIVHVPGRNGDIVIDKGSYKNANRSYDIAIGDVDKDFSVMANYISEWLHSASGYARLEDSYESDYYRMAMYRESSDIKNILEHGGRVTINFDCKPQRFLKSGERVIKFIGAGVLRNQTNFEAFPIIRVSGSGDGVLLIGSHTIQLSSMTDYVTINSEIQDVYNGTTNMNRYVKLTNGFPTLAPGANEISFSGGITAVEVIPKWWTL